MLEALVATFLVTMLLLAVQTVVLTSSTALRESRLRLAHAFACQDEQEAGWVRDYGEGDLSGQPWHAADPCGSGNAAWGHNTECRL